LQIKISHRSFFFNRKHRKQFTIISSDGPLAGEIFRLKGGPAFICNGYINHLTHESHFFYTFNRITCFGPILSCCLFSNDIASIYQDAFMKDTIEKSVSMESAEATHTPGKSYSNKPLSQELKVVGLCLGASTVTMVRIVSDQKKSDSLQQTPAS
jgi:hypothetical protein